MRLSDIMSKAGLASYAEVAVIIFFVVFLVIAYDTFRRGRKEELEEASRIPLDDDVPSHLRTTPNDNDTEVTS